MVIAGMLMFIFGVLMAFLGLFSNLFRFNGNNYGMIISLIFLLTFILPGVILLCVGRRKSNKHTKKTQNKIKRCSKCRQKIVDDNNFCVYCGNKLYDSNNNEDVFCTKCGTKLSSNNLFCSKCGERIKK